MEKSRNQMIMDRYEQGESIVKIGHEFGISRQRAHQIIKTICDRQEAKALSDKNSALNITDEIKPTLLEILENRKENAEKLGIPLNNYLSNTGL